MSQNNVHIVYEESNKWYGWDELAEAHDGDRPWRILHKRAAVTSNSFDDIIEKLRYLHDNRAAEYGIVLVNKGYKSDASRLPKDKTRIKVVD